MFVQWAHVVWQGEGTSRQWGRASAHQGRPGDVCSGKSIVGPSSRVFA